MDGCDSGTQTQLGEVRKTREAWNNDIKSWLVISVQEWWVWIDALHEVRLAQRPYMLDSNSSVCRVTRTRV